MSLETALAIGLVLAVLTAMAVEWRRSRVGTRQDRGLSRLRGGAERLPPH